MADTDLRSIVLGCLQAVAPEAQLAHLAPSQSFNEQIDINSVDYLNFVMRIEEALGIQIAEEDYPRLSSLDGCLALLGEMTSTPGKVSAP